VPNPPQVRSVADREQPEAQEQERKNHPSNPAEDATSAALAHSGVATMNNKRKNGAIAPAACGWPVLLFTATMMLAAEIRTEQIDRAPERASNGLRGQWLMSPDELQPFVDQGV
jgi:hypothetical protein